MRILVAGDPRSIHTARFSALLRELGHEVHLFAVEWHYAQEEHLRDVTLHVPLAYEPGSNGVRVIGRHRWTAILCRQPSIRRAFAGILYRRQSPGRLHRAEQLARLADRLA